ncbi:sec-independent protein translocase protein TatA [Flavobacterium succinicans]|jgi:sec-independent protein translocase protein TatA|uniref:Sec-independent protein translocase protein TatA n=1 Tax=Flavobacterium succinicans TaxID=29536 RepID=A0A1I4S2J9_9FLAO|nr:MULTISPECIES: twin-arginine translocase TatA/TatE family subunit [Flavobacterium]OOV29112.1 Sec-independent protein translocase TatA [Flavobacterium sp. LM5]SFM58772.1 sec-independent protein translocase protein TatA [Flavobacterium succinicans]
MFGIGGGELIFILFIVLMLFGSDKVPEMARTMGKAMAQLKHATNDIKNEIQKGAEANGLDQKSLSDLTGGFNAEIEKAKQSLLGDSTNSITNLANDITSEINQAAKSTVADAKESADAINNQAEGPVKRQM